MIRVSNVSPRGELLEHDEGIPVTPRVIDNPAVLRSLVSLGEDYWQDELGRGAGAFEVVRDGLARFGGENLPVGSVDLVLEVSKLDEFGIWLRLSSGDRDYLAVNERATEDVWASLLLDGEPEPWPSCFFHPEDRSVIVIEEFCAIAREPTFNLPQSLVWIEESAAAIDTAGRRMNNAVLSRENWNYSP